MKLFFKFKTNKMLRTLERTNSFEVLNDEWLTVPKNTMFFATTDSYINERRIVFLKNKKFCLIRPEDLENENLL